MSSRKTNKKLHSSEKPPVFKKLYPVNVMSGIRYIRFELNWVCTKNSKGGAFCTIERFFKNVVSGIRYIRNSFYPEFFISGLRQIRYGLPTKKKRLSLNTIFSPSFSLLDTPHFFPRRFLPSACLTRRPLTSSIFFVQSVLATTYFDCQE